MEKIGKYTEAKLLIGSTLEKNMQEVLCDDDCMFDFYCILFVLCPKKSIPIFEYCITYEYFVQLQTDDRSTLMQEIELCLQKNQKKNVNEVS